MSLVGVADIEFGGMYLGRYEKQVLEKLCAKPKQFGEQIRENALAKNSKLILDWFDNADIAFGNLETCLAKPRKHYPSRTTYYHFRQDPSTVEDLKLLGINIVSLGNNIVTGYGDQGVIDTIEALDGAGIKHVGAGMNIEEALTPAFFDLEEQSIAFLSFASSYSQAAAPDSWGVAAIRHNVIYEYETPRLPIGYIPFYAGLPKIKQLPVEADVYMMQECIKGVKDEAGFVVVSMHWGPGSPLSIEYLGLNHALGANGIPTENLGRHRRVGFDPTPTEGQRILGHAIIDAGADLIIGHGCHTAQGVEIYKGKHIFYSLGQFLMQIELDIIRHAISAYRAYMIKVDIEKNKVSRAEILPIRMDEATLPIISEEYKSVIEALREVSTPLNASLISYKKGAIVKPITQ